MVGDAPPIPFLAMDRAQIARRVASKEILRRFFLEKGVRWHTTEASDTHGEFCSVAEWRTRHRGEFEKWVAESMDVGQVSAVVTARSRLLPSQVQSWAEESLVSSIDSAVSMITRNNSSLGECLADAGILPMLGMPTRVRELYLYVFENDPRSQTFGKKTIDRDLELAITEFAPGSKRVKDKRIFECNGFTPTLIWNRSSGRGHWAPQGNALERTKLILWCPECLYFEAEGVTDSAGGCLRCGCPVGDEHGTTLLCNAAAPAGFRVVNAPAAAVGEDDEHGVSTRSFLAVPATQFEKSTNYSNAALESGFPEVFRVNDNRRELFSVRAGHGDENPIAKGLRPNHGPYSGQLIAAADGTEALGIYASKKTDVLRIRHTSVPLGIQLDPIQGGPAVRAAFYSAAELLKRAWALELDVDPEEFDVPPIEVVPLDVDPWHRQGVITLADHHPNGAGFVSELESRWRTFLPRLLRGETHYARRLLDPSKHVRQCHRACYMCLRGYRNRFIDGLLDWRLAARGESRSYEGSTQSIRRTTLTRMAMGTRETDQPPLWIATSDLPTSPGHPFYARLTTLLDGHHFDRFVEGLCDRFYAPVMGRPSLAPGRYFRLLLVGYFEGIDSERGMAWRATDSLAVRSFLRLAVDEAPPDHSTIARTRRLIDLETHRTVFTWVQQRLVEAGRLTGKTIAIDATTLEANAAMRSIVRRDTGESYQAFLAGLATASGVETPTREGLARLDRKRKKKTSNTDWTNPHDPDAKVTKMKDGRTHLAHKAEHAVDMETGAIVAVTLQGADVGDTTTIIETAIAATEQVEDAQANVDDRQSLEEIVGDKGYHSNQTLIDLDAGGIRSYVSEPDRGRRDWSKDPEARAPVYGNRRRMRGRRGRRLMRQRGERIERSFAHLYDTGGMRRTHLRGHTNILKRLLIHAGGFNLGLVMRHLIGIGTPRGLQGRVAAVLATLGVLMGVVRRRLTTISSSHRLIPAVRGRLASLATFAVNSSAAITCTTGC